MFWTTSRLLNILLMNVTPGIPKRFKNSDFRNYIVNTIHHRNVSSRLWLTNLIAFLRSSHSFHSYDLTMFVSTGWMSVCVPLSHLEVDCTCKISPGCICKTTRQQLSLNHTLSKVRMWKRRVILLFHFVFFYFKLFTHVLMVSKIRNLCGKASLLKCVLHKSTKPGRGC